MAKRLRASNTQVDPVSNMFGFGADGSIDMPTMLNFLSMAIWGLVMTKANQGLEAAKTGDANAVTGLMKKATTLCGLILIASGAKYAKAYFEEPQQVAQPIVEPAALKPKLQMSQSAQHLKSYFDETSSHYKGGMHNSALASLSNKEIPSQKYLGGAHNVALQRFKNIESARQPEPSFSEKVATIYASSFGEDSQSRTFIGEHFALIAFVCVAAASYVYYSAFSAYHDALHVETKLAKVYNNPNAKVTDLETSNRIVKKLKSQKTQVTPIEKDQTFAKIAELLAAKQNLLQAQQPLLYQPPALVTEYKLEPVQPMANFYPQISMPPQPVFQMSTPAPQMALHTVQNLSKQEILALLASKL